jgi:NADPH-dependent curcumin reductase CurA
MTSTDETCRWLTDELGLDAAINYRAPGGVEAGISEHCPNGVDVFFDNVGGKTLETVLDHLNIGARVVMSGAVSSYNATEPVPGPYNMFKIITQRATMKGFMVTDYVEQYPQALETMLDWLISGRIVNAEEVIEGIENTPRAWCRMFEGGNRGKLVVRLEGGKG